MYPSNNFGKISQTSNPTLPDGEEVASYKTYAQAQKAVDVLMKADFPGESVSIVGSDLKVVERVIGKLTWGRVALAGAGSGAWLGIFFGLLFMLFSPTVTVGYLSSAVLIGAGFGILFGFASYAVKRKIRDYNSVMQVLASYYCVIVPVDLAYKAKNLLQEQGLLLQQIHSDSYVSVPDVIPAPNSEVEQFAVSLEDLQPPEYGERITPPTKSSGEKSEG